MQILKLMFTLMLLVVALTFPLVSFADDELNPGLFHGGEEAVITQKMTAQLWQWALSIPSSVHPLSVKNNDPTGARYCMVGQQGNVWYLGGVFKTVDVSPESKQSQSNGNGIEPIEIERECHNIPLGKSILIPVVSAECNTAEELALENEVPENLREKLHYLRDCAKILADAVDKNTAFAYFGPTDDDGTWIQDPLELKVKRVRTVKPFSITYPPDNILSSDCGTPDEFFCEPDPNPSLAQADGYWALVQPQKPGTYKLQVFGEVPDFEFALQVTYKLTVVGPEDQ